MKTTINSLPTRIKVKVKKGTIAKYLAQLPELDIFTEADSLAELQININDLICTFFDIPKKYQQDLWYRPAVNNPNLIPIKSIDFNKLIASHYCIQ